MVQNMYSLEAVHNYVISYFIIKSFSVCLAYCSEIQNRLLQNHSSSLRPVNLLTV